MPLPKAHKYGTLVTKLKCTQIWHRYLLVVPSYILDILLAVDLSNQPDCAIPLSKLSHLVYCLLPNTLITAASIFGPTVLNRNRADIKCQGSAFFMGFRSHLGNKSCSALYNWLDHSIDKQFVTCYLRPTRKTALNQANRHFVAKFSNTQSDQCLLRQ